MCDMIVYMYDDDDDSRVTRQVNKVERGEVGQPSPLPPPPPPQGTREGPRERGSKGFLLLLCHASHTTAVLLLL